MQLSFLFKTKDSWSGNCPAVYQADDGGYVIQGRTLDDDTTAQLRDHGPNESAVWVPADIVAQIKKL